MRRSPLVAGFFDGEGTLNVIDWNNEGIKKGKYVRSYEGHFAVFFQICEASLIALIY